MTVISVLDFHFNPDTVDEALALFSVLLKDTRAFEGCISVEVVQDVDDPGHVQLVEKWEGVENDKAYRAWRATPEGSAGGASLGPHIAGPVTTTVSLVREDV
jgi:heme oxygenase (mycobilin-producing)